jgi:uncharacterized protein YecE (DUF72 family)
VLVQLPANLPLDLSRLVDTLDAFPSGTKVAVEPRHPSWPVEPVAEVLAARDHTFCLSDAPGRAAPRWRTASWGYVRMHAGRAAPWPCYGTAALRRRAERLAELWRPDDEVHVYFNNDGASTTTVLQQRRLRLCRARRPALRRRPPPGRSGAEPGAIRPRNAGVPSGSGHVRLSRGQAR